MINVILYDVSEKLWCLKIILRLSPKIALPVIFRMCRAIFRAFDSISTWLTDESGKDEKVLQPPLRRIGCRQLLKMRLPLKKIQIRCKTHTCLRLLSQMNNNYLLNILQGFYRHIIWDIIIFHIICTAPLNGSR